MSEKYQKLALRLGKSLLQPPKNNLKRMSANSYFTYSPEPAQPLNKDPKWTTAEDAVSCIKSGLCYFFLVFYVQI